MYLNYKKMLFTMMDALDCVEKELLGIRTGHIQRVAYLYLLLASRMNTDQDKLIDLATCALLHDNAIQEYIDGEYQYNTEDWREEWVGLHCKVGEENLKDFPYRTDMSNIILYHHEHADGTGPFGKMAAETPLYARLLHLCDTVDRSCYRAGWADRDYEYVKGFLTFGTGTYFDSEVTELFLGHIKESDFIYFQHCNMKEELERMIPEIAADYSYEKMRTIAGIIAHIIDYKSEFTGRHSIQLAAKADVMADYYQMPVDEKEQFYIAAALHDIGKLLIHNRILEKNGRLTEEEFDVMKNHAFYTNQILSQISGFEQVAEWASNHHEKLNGGGYPLGKKADQLDRNSRLLACLDIYQALTEERPYKQGMNHEQSIQILMQMVDRGELDPSIVRDMNIVFNG